MAWIATVTFEGKSGVEKKNIMAASLSGLYVKVYTVLNLDILEILIHRDTK